MFIDVKLAADAPVLSTGSLRRQARNGRSLPAGAVRLRLAPGAHRVRLGTRRPLSSGRYALKLAAGTFSRSVRFRVR